MMNSSLGAGAVVALSIAAPLPAAADPSGALRELMPVPLRVEAGAGALILDRSFTAAAAGAADPRVEAALRELIARLGRRLGQRLPSPARAASARTVLVVESAGPGRPVQAVDEDESYRLEITTRRARITAGNPLGVLRGLATFEQLVTVEAGRGAAPAATIEDRPRFPWRGLLIDPCRRWQPVEVIRRTLEAMAAVKLNVLHWHLSEDQGFRVESRRFPRLHELGSDGLYYTQDQVREVIACARERGIRVVPEFDVPGHSTSWLVGHPELASAPAPFSLIRKWGIFDNNLDPSREEVYQFLDAFIGEMAALFPDAYFHVGGDEVTARQWNENPRILDFMYRNRLRNAHDLQAHFNRRVNAIVTRHGKKMMGWDEVLHPDLPRDIVVHSWRGAEALAQAARQGYDGILSNGYYLDHMMPAAFHYAADPVPPDSSLSLAERRHVLGGEACMWGEFVDAATIDSRIWPRAAAVAERLWSPQEVRDVDDMYRRLDIQSRRLAERGATHESTYVQKLQRLVEGHAVEPLQRLGDVLQPAKRYGRLAARAYTSATPLDRLVDAVAPESRAARQFRAAVDGLLRQASADRSDAAVRAVLASWKANHEALEPILAASARAAEARGLSRDLSDLGALGLEALEHLASGRTPPAAWQARAAARLEEAGRVQAELELAVIAAVRKLALAAARVEGLRTIPMGEWNAQLDAAVLAAEQPTAEH